MSQGKAEMGHQFCKMPYHNGALKGHVLLKKKYGKTLDTEMCIGLVNLSRSPVQWLASNLNWCQALEV